MFKSELHSSYPELLLQAQPVVGSPGVVKPLQMALQRAHIEFCVSIQIVLQQSLVDEGVLHLRRKTEEVRGGKRCRRSCFSLLKYFLLFSHHRHGCFQCPCLFMLWLEQWVELSVQGTTGQRVNTYICLDELTALLSYSAHKAERIHPLFHVHHVDHAVNDNERPSPPNPSTAQNTNKKAQGLLCSKQLSDAIKQHVSKGALWDIVFI